jgi:ribosome-associated translation inhibitor RaiA
MTNLEQITFRHMDPSPAVAQRVAIHVAKLRQHFPQLSSCRVVIEAPHHHRQRGPAFHVQLDLRLPGAEIVVKHEPNERQLLAESAAASVHKSTEVDSAHKDAYIALHDAFDIAHRRLEDHVRRDRQSSLRESASDKPGAD